MIIILYNKVSKVKMRGRARMRNKKGITNGPPPPPAPLIVRVDLVAGTEYNSCAQLPGREKRSSLLGRRMPPNSTGTWLCLALCSERNFSCREQ